MGSYSIRVVALTCLTVLSTRFVSGEQDQLLRNEIIEMKARLAHLESLLNKKSANSISTYEKNSRNGAYRTCEELLASDPTLTSGMYWIDPDGAAIGDEPIEVHCDKATGTTSVTHDSEDPTDVGHCEEPGCYSRKVNYAATMNQIKALKAISAECHQFNKYECNYAPYYFDGIEYAWWDDINGNPQYFWAGDNGTVHTCQCGIDNTCVEASKTCTCDSLLPLPLSDEGNITDKSILPITQLHFGRTLLSSSSGKHTLGRLQCSGKIAVSGGMPTSCADFWLTGAKTSGLYVISGLEQIELINCDFTKLQDDPGYQQWVGYVNINRGGSTPKSCADFWRTGITISGLYSISGSEQVELIKCDFTKQQNDPGYQQWVGYVNVNHGGGPPQSCIDYWRTGTTTSGLYSILGSEQVELIKCDFTKQQNDPGYQKWVGYVGVKSSPVYFYVQMCGDYQGTNTPIPWCNAVINVGGAMNVGGGTFTAPKRGRYFFSFSGVSYTEGGTSDGYNNYVMKLNGNTIGNTKAELTQGLSTDVFSMQATLQLEAGDRVWLEQTRADHSYMYDHSGHHNHFTGWMIEEDVVRSVNAINN